MPAGDFAILLKALGGSFLICAVVTVIARPLGVGAASLCTLGGFGVGGLAMIFGVPNSILLLLAPIVGGWSGYWLGALLRSFLET
jgi:hypothetical protein